MIKVLFICHGSISKSPEKSVKSMVLQSRKAPTTPFLKAP